MLGANFSALVVNMASCVSEQAVFIVRFGEIVLQLQINYRQRFKTLKTLGFKIPLNSVNLWYCNLFTIVRCTETGRICRIEDLMFVWTCIIDVII